MLVILLSLRLFSNSLCMMAAPSRTNADSKTQRLFLSFSLSLFLSFFRHQLNPRMRRCKEDRLCATKRRAAEEVHKKTSGTANQLAAARDQNKGASHARDGQARENDMFAACELTKRRISD